MFIKSITSNSQQQNALGYNLSMQGIQYGVLRLTNRVWNLDPTSRKGISQEISYLLAVGLKS